MFSVALTQTGYTSVILSSACSFLWLAVQIKHQQARENPSAAVFSAVVNNYMLVTV